MNNSIFILNKNEQLDELREKNYDSELILQELLSKYPDLLAGGQINEANPRKWLLIANEISVGNQEENTNWSVDNLFIDQDGIPTIIEVKRSTDTRIRREVIGQMLDYAANAVTYWPIEHLKTTYENRCIAEKLDPSQELINVFGIASDYEDFWMQVKTNLQAGKIRMVFVADVIPGTLKRVVEFLNTQMDPAEVLALEVKKFSNNNLTTLVPKLIGQTAEAQQRKTQIAGEEWTDDRFFSALKNNATTSTYNSVKKLYEWAVRKNLKNYWGKGKKSGSWIPAFDSQGAYFPFIFWSEGSLNIQFDVIARRPLFESRQSRLELLNKLKNAGINLPESAVDKGAYIKKAINNDDFIKVFEWLYNLVRAS